MLRCPVLHIFFSLVFGTNSMSTCFWVTILTTTLHSPPLLSKRWRSLLNNEVTFYVSPGYLGGEICMCRSFSSTSINKDAHDDANQSSPVPVEEVRRYATECMISAGAGRDHSAALAELLVTADYRGHYSHGLNRLGTNNWYSIKLSLIWYSYRLHRNVRERCT